MVVGFGIIWIAQKKGKNCGMDLFNTNFLPEELYKGLMYGFIAISIIILLTIIMVIRQRGNLIIVNCVIAFIDLLKITISIVTIIFILICGNKIISIATLIVGVLAIIEFTSSLASILKTIFNDRLEK